MTYSRCCSYLTGSKYTIRPYMYIKALDLLFKFPKFNYHSTTSTKLRDTAKGLMVLYSILNLEPKEFYEYMGTNFEGLHKCGWASAMQTAKASYSTNLFIEQPGDAVKGTPPPENQEATSEDEGAVNEMLTKASHYSPPRR